MKDIYYLKTLIKRYPILITCKKDIQNAYFLLENCFEKKHKLLIAGNGGSSADADHIVGELMKGFKKNRLISSELKQRLLSIDSCAGLQLSSKLQYGLRCIALHNHFALNTAYINDIDTGANYFYAQQVLNYGDSDDVFLGISTSGNSKNIYNAFVVAKALGMKTIALTGNTGGLLKSISDISIIVPEKETFIVQEYHLPIYHCLCLMLENHFFK